ncbi:hypothetical protein CLAIMM_15143 [Cladophialophora immunda]|nr:hypothetical protein CLAIMM_15143 [Cladophialophora immunda]
MRLVSHDEVDTLLGGDCEVLYSIFEWAMHPSSTLILIGIANALDLPRQYPVYYEKGYSTLSYCWNWINIAKILRPGLSISTSADETWRTVRTVVAAVLLEGKASQYRTKAKKYLLGTSNTTRSANHQKTLVYGLTDPTLDERRRQMKAWRSLRTSHNKQRVSF